MCMHNLENKDQSCRKKGIKRYWVVTNVDRVAADIKHNMNILTGQPVFTRDFTRMYTSIPQTQLVASVKGTIQEVFEWHSKKTAIPVSDLRVKVTYPTANHAVASFAKEGFTFDEICEMLCRSAQMFISNKGRMERF